MPRRVTLHFRHAIVPLRLHAVCVTWRLITLPHADAYFIIFATISSLSLITLPRSQTYHYTPLLDCLSYESRAMMMLHIVSTPPAADHADFTVTTRYYAVEMFTPAFISHTERHDEPPAIRHILERRC